LARVIAQAGRVVEKGQGELAHLSLRLDAAPAARFTSLSQRLDALDRTRQTLGYAETLKRGYAVLRGDGVVVTTKAQAEKANVLEAEFQDGRLTIGSKAKKPKDGAAGQGSLFD
jgi:exodeoxyribonuclease VII large subunit